MARGLDNSFYFLQFLAAIDTKEFYFIVEKNAITQTIYKIEKMRKDVEEGIISEEKLANKIEWYVSIFNIHCKEVLETIRFDEKKLDNFEEFMLLFNQLKSNIIYLGGMNPKKKKK